MPNEDGRELSEIKKPILDLSTAIIDIWPQKTVDGPLTYLFGGSMAVNLIAMSTSCIAVPDIVSPVSLPKQLQQFIRPVADVDIVPLQVEYSPDALMLPEQKARQLDKLTTSGDLKIDNLYHNYKSKHNYQLVVGDREFFVASFDIIAASKLLSCLTSFNKKPQILSSEIPKQIKIASDLYGGDRLWRLVQEIFQTELDLGATEPRWMTVPYQVERLLEHDLISDKLKKLVKIVASSVGIL